MENLYEALTESVPAGEKIRRVVRGRWQGYVETESGAGVSSLLFPGGQPFEDSRVFPEWEGRSLRDLAAMAAGEDDTMAPLGVAAMNAWHNRPEALRMPSAAVYPPESKEGDVFLASRELCAGKIVSTIGHFRGSEALTGMKELRIFEKEPRTGDYPAEREEELLPESDVVIVTGMALTNHTMEHILELSRNAAVLLTGPSVPLTPLWKEFGVHSLFGAAVWDIPGCRTAAEKGGHKAMWPCLEKIVLIL